MLLGEDNQSINQSVNFYSGLSDRSHFEDQKSASKYDRCSKNVFKCFLKDWSVAAVMTCSGKEFQIRGAANGKARLPTVDSLTDGETK